MPLSPLFACHPVTHFKVLTVSVLHPSALFSAHLRGFCHSKSAYEALSITIPWKSWKAKQNSLEMPPQAPGHPPVSTTFHLSHIRLPGCENPLCLVVVFLTHRSVNLRVFSACQLGRAILITLRVKGPQCLQTNKNTALLSSAAGCYTSHTPRPCRLLIFQSPFAAWVTLIGVSGVEAIG